MNNDYTTVSEAARRERSRGIGNVCFETGGSLPVVTACPSDTFEIAIGALPQGARKFP